MAKKQKRYTVKVHVEITREGKSKPVRFHEAPVIWYRCKKKNVLLLESELIEMLKRLNQHGWAQLKKRKK
ncbi:hypothetical protein LCGC14_2077540 [marine sediment metagenome]|uniref:Uncharacterized protein n=1 Tax=marine sediment metagenome TaxID=412755 RepID=A0A0F9HDG9_9ZZZZ